MTVAIERPESMSGGSVLLYGVSWKTYEALLAEVENRRLRLTYDRGRLEIMSPSRRHERIKTLLGRLIETMTEELGIPISSGGSTTFKSQLLEKGLEPDECYWIATEPLVRAKDEIVLGVDPAPDLAVEVDITRNALDRFPVYASLGFGEIWHWKDDRLVFHVLSDAEYVERARSSSLPFLAPEALTPFLAQAHATDETTWIRRFRAWVRENLKGSAS